MSAATSASSKPFQKLSSRRSPPAIDRNIPHKASRVLDMADTVGSTEDGDPFRAEAPRLFHQPVSHPTLASLIRPSPADFTLPSLCSPSSQGMACSPAHIGAFKRNMRVRLRILATTAANAQKTVSILPPNRVPRPRQTIGQAALRPASWRGGLEKRISGAAWSTRPLGPHRCLIGC